MQGSFDRFTERARRVLSLSQEEAKGFNHNYIGPEHLLLGLIREGDGVAARALSNLGVELTTIRTSVEFIIGRGQYIVEGEIGLTPPAKKVIELAVDEARRLGHHYIGTEHLFLGMVREGDGIAAGVLESVGVTLDKARAEVIRVLTRPGGEEEFRETPTLQADSAPEASPFGGLIWEYLVVQTERSGGETTVRSVEGSADPGFVSGTTTLSDALALLGMDGWDLAGIDSVRGEGSAPGALYVFKRPRRLFRHPRRG